MVSASSVCRSELPQFFIDVGLYSGPFGDAYELTSILQLKDMDDNAHPIKCTAQLTKEMMDSIAEVPFFRRFSFLRMRTRDLFLFAAPCALSFARYSEIARGYE